MDVNRFPSTALEAERGTGLLSAMNVELVGGAERRRQATAIVLVETLGTAGALVGFGWRSGDPVRPFRLAGFALLERTGFPAAQLPQLALTVGIFHHVLVGLLWGVLLSVSFTVFRSLGSALAVLLSTATFAVLQLTELPPILRIGYAVTFDRVHVVAVSVAVALSLWLAQWALGSASVEPAS